MGRESIKKAILEFYQFNEPFIDFIIFIVVIELFDFLW